MNVSKLEEKVKEIKKYLRNGFNEDKLNNFLEKLKPFASTNDN